MSDSGVGAINIEIIVDKTSVDEALATIEESIEKKQATVSSRSGSGGGGSRFKGVPNVGNTFKKSIDEEIARTVQDEIDSVIQTDVSETVKEAAFEIKGLETAVHRIARMIPGIREVDRIYKNVGRAQRGYLMMAGINFALIAWRVLRMISDYLEKLKRQRQETEATIRQLQGITSHQGYSAYQYQQRLAISSYRNGATNR